MQAWCSSKDPQCVSSSCHRKTDGALSFHGSLPACLMYLAVEGKLAGAMKEPHCIKGTLECRVAANSSAQLPQAHLGSSFCQRAWAQREVRDGAGVCFAKLACFGFSFGKQDPVVQIELCLI